MLSRRLVSFCLALIVSTVAHVAAQEEQHVVAVHTDAELRDALRTAVPGTRIEIAPGEYTSVYVEGLRGELDRPIVVAGADPANPPRFQRGGTGIHLVDPRFVVLEDLDARGATDNGVNIDDGGRVDLAARGLVLRRLHVANIGPVGNHDGLKLSGICGFHIEDCTVEHWGARGGSGIDLVGCHDGAIERCRFRHDPSPDATGASGIQVKGGSTDIAIRLCDFRDAGLRAINIGGSTGLEYFRPPLVAGARHSEAARVLVEGNTFRGSQAPIAFVGVDGATVRFNTFASPGKWILRILEENTAEGFVPSQRGVFTDNVVVFDSASWSAGGVNVGPGAAPETFEFARNLWFCADAPQRSAPNLPTVESGAVLGVDPRLDGELRVTAGGQARGRGADPVRALADADAKANALAPIRVYVLAGQSNMEGKAKVALLAAQCEQARTRERFAHLLREDGSFATRNDVFVVFGERTGALTVGFGSPGCIGPELEFGHVVGERVDAPVLIVKAAWGGRSLQRDFRPPSAGLPSEALLADWLDDAPELTAADVERSVGASYRALLDDVRDALGRVHDLVPGSSGRGAELAGFVWFQGWNDMLDEAATAEYSSNLAHLVRDVRRDLVAPDLPVVVGQFGVGGVANDQRDQLRFKAAQAEITQLDEFRTSLALVATDVFWDFEAQRVFDAGWQEHLDEWNRVGSDYPYHYLGSARTLCDIGRAFAEAVLELEQRAHVGD